MNLPNIKGLNMVPKASRLMVFACVRLNDALCWYNTHMQYPIPLVE